MPSEQNPRILICRLSAIGDTILTLPVACALRQQFPNAHIAWVVERKSAPMVRNHPALDQVIELERGWLKSISQVRSVRAQLRSQRFDIAVDPQGLTKSSMAAWLSGAPKRIGFAGRHGGELSRLLNNTFVKPVFTHLTDRSLELLVALDIHSPKVQWKLHIPKHCRDWASKWRAALGSDRVAVLNPGATAKSKMWEPDRFAATARYLKKSYKYDVVVVWGSPAERAMADSIVTQSQGTATLAPATDLHQLAALIEASDLFISGDTGPLHMSVAVGTTTIGLYGATLPFYCGPYGHKAIQVAYEGGSRKHRRNADNTAMRQIQALHVCDAIDDVESKQHLIRPAA